MPCALCCRGDGATPSKHVRSGELSDKLIMHIATVALWIQGFKFDIAVLAKDLKLSPSKLLGYFKVRGVALAVCAHGIPLRRVPRCHNASVLPIMVQELGCRFSATTAQVDGHAVKSFQVSLELPLVFPQKKKGGKAR